VKNNQKCGSSRKLVNLLLVSSCYCFVVRGNFCVVCSTLLFKLYQAVHVRPWESCQPTQINRKPEKAEYGVGRNNPPAPYPTMEACSRSKLSASMISSIDDLWLNLPTVLGSDYWQVTGLTQKFVPKSSWVV